MSVDILMGEPLNLQTELKKKRQPSRKGKKAWRANIDIEDVEDGLEVKRADERTGSVAEIADHQLFTLDGDADAKAAQAVKRTLRMDEIINERSKIPAVYGRVPKAAKDKRIREFSQTTRSAINKLANKKNFKKVEKKIVAKPYDLWTTSVEKPKQENVLNDFTTHMKTVAVNPPASVSIRLKGIDAVEVSHPGTSYNPHKEQHKELIALAGDIEVQKEIRRVELEEHHDKIKTAQLQSNGPEDMLDTISGSESEGSDDETKDIRKMPGRKTQAERRKKARHEATLRLHQLKKSIPKLSMQGLVKLAQEVNNRADAKDVELAQRFIARKELASLVKTKLGKYKVPTPVIDVQMEDEIADNLRAHVPEGNLFRDRFLSLQKRNLIEPRVRASNKRRYGRPTVEKFSYKQWDIQNK